MRASIPSVAFFTCLGLVLASSFARAQAVPLPSPSPSATTPAPGAPVPDMPEVSDPMLTPVVAPPTSLHKWEEALVYIRSRSTDLRTAEIEINRAEAQWRQALAGALPSINLNASLTHQLITNTSSQVSGIDAVGNPVFRQVESPFPNAANGSLTLVQPLLATRPWYALGTAKQAEQVARLNVEDVKRQIALRVANGMVAVVTAERLAELNRVGLRNALERLELTQRKANLGAATGLDVVRARQDVEAARTSLVSGDESLRQSREALGLALGVPQAVGVAPDVRIDGLEQAAVATCKPSSKLEDRPDVASAQASILLAARARGDAKRQFAPTVNFQSTISSTSIDTGATPQTTWNIQGVLQVPIWDGGARYATLRTADVDTEKAAQRLEAVKRQATIEIVQARRSVEVAETSKDVALKSRDLAKETDRLVRTSYQEGRGTSLELVAAATTLRQAEITLALREFDVVKARVAAVLSLSSCQY
jgi:outer membrane protein TolC